MAEGASLLTISGLNVYYGRLHVLKGVALHVNQGEVVALLGANGAGKTTTLRAICGLLKPSAGNVNFAGQKIAGLSADKLVRQGITQVPEGRQIFGPLSIHDNLLLGAYTRLKSGGKASVNEDLDRVYGMFPILAEKRHDRGGSLSGGQQQMLAMGRALMSRPRLLLLDEPCLGLAPLVAKQIMAIIAQLREQGTTIMVVEQNARAALAVADRGYVMETGKVVLEGSSEELRRNKEVRRAYLGKDYEEV
jgi:branched-chain amino acid transport system ATP-binding protein